MLGYQVLTDWRSISLRKHFAQSAKTTPKPVLTAMTVEDSRRKREEPSENRAEANHSSRRALLDCCKNGGTRRDENVIGHEPGGALTMKSQLFREAAAGSGIALYIREPALWRHVMPDDAHRDVHRVSWSESWQLLLAPRRQVQQRDDCTPACRQLILVISMNTENCLSIHC